MNEPADLDGSAAPSRTPPASRSSRPSPDLAAPYWKPHAKAAFTGMSLGTERGHLVRAVHRRHRRPGGAAGACRRPRSRRAAHPAAGRRRADPQPPAAADPGRSAAVPGGGLPLAVRHGARRRGVWPLSAPGSLTAQSYRAWTPVAIVEPASRPPKPPTARRLAGPPPRRRWRCDRRRPASTFDVAVIGAGVVGSRGRPPASPPRPSRALVEAGPDVGAGTSKANTAILHTGFDATPGTLESRLVARG